MDYWTKLSGVDYSNEDSYYMSLGKLTVCEPVRGNILIIDNLVGNRLLSIIANPRKILAIIEAFPGDIVPIRVTIETQFESHVNCS